MSASEAGSRAEGSRWNKPTKSPSRRSRTPAACRMRLASGDTFPPWGVGPAGAGPTAHGGVSDGIPPRIWAVSTRGPRGYGDMPGIWREPPGGRRQGNLSLRRESPLAVLSIRRVSRRGIPGISSPQPREWPVGRRNCAPRKCGLAGRPVHPFASLGREGARQVACDTPQGARWRAWRRIFTVRCRKSSTRRGSHENNGRLD